MSGSALSFFNQYAEDFAKHQEDTLTFEDYLDQAKNDPSYYANPWERLLKAIGEPQPIDYAKEPNLRAVFENLPVSRYPGFKGFYGIEDSVKQIVSFLRSAAQGGEESKQILYLLGPVGSSKSSLAKRLTELMEQEPFYAIKGSPVFDSPLSVFNARKYGEMIEKEYGINSRYLATSPSPWLLSELKKAGGDVRKLKVVKLYPSRLKQLAISRVEAGDKNNQDVSSIIGKVDLSKLDGGLSQHDPDAYGYSGGLNLGNRGAMEFVEMFKAPIDALNPLLAATQDHQYNGTEAIGALPFEGVIIAHSNESEWKKFRNDPTNEAFIDRVRTIRVPYVLRVDDELKIYEKYVRESALREAPCAPHTLKILAEFAVATRLCDPKDGSDLETKMKVYNGERTNDAKAKTLKAYREDSEEQKYDEGMKGWSVRASFKVLSDTFNYRAEQNEIAASPIDLMFILDRTIRAEKLQDEVRDRYLLILHKQIMPAYLKKAEKELQEALLESYDGFAQDLFKNYVAYAELALSEDDDLLDPITNMPVKREAIEKKLTEIEKPAGISSPKDFREGVVRFVYGYQAKHDGAFPEWKGFKKFEDAIHKKIAGNMKDLKAHISFDPRSNAEDTEKHTKFVQRMETRGYTSRQVRQLVDWVQANLG